MDLFCAQSALFRISAFCYAARLVSGENFGLLSNLNSSLNKWLLVRLCIVAIYKIYISSVDLFCLSHCVKADIYLF